MIDIDREKLMTLGEAAAYLPRHGSKPVHTNTVARWARNGLRGVRLEVTCRGSRLLTSEEACKRFLAALTVARTDRLQKRFGGMAPLAIGLPDAAARRGLAECGYDLSPTPAETPIT